MHRQLAPWDPSGTQRLLNSNYFQYFRDDYGCNYCPVSRSVESCNPDLTLQEFGYKVIPINPFSAGERIHGEIIVAKLSDVRIPIDIVDIFRPSKETPPIAEEAVKIGAKVFWLQYGIQNDEAKKIVESKNISYISNKCIKQEYQRLFLKISPVFPALKN